MTMIYVPDGIYDILLEFNKKTDPSRMGFTIHAHDGLYQIRPMSRTFFIELSKSQLFLESLEKISKEKEKQRLQEQIEMTYQKHQSLLEKLKDFE